MFVLQGSRFAHFAARYLTSAVYAYFINFGGAVYFCFTGVRNFAALYFKQHSIR